MKKVLIITYYWPPSGGSPVIRWLKFAKYLNSFGWKPIIYTAKNAEYPEIDHSLGNDVPSHVKVIKKEIWEPYQAYKRFIGAEKKTSINTGFLSEKKKPGFLEKISVWIRGNLFIPDARKFWINPSYKYLLNYLQSNPVDIIVSTGPPHSTHVIAMKIKEKTGIKWVADFRDPWTNIDFYDQLMLSKWADKKHKTLEKKVLQFADHVITVSQTMMEEFIAIKKNNVSVITNGFDEDEIPEADVILDEKFTISHFGSMNKARDPVSLWIALNELVKELPGLSNDMVIKLYGKVDYQISEKIKTLELDKLVKLINYIPRDKAIKEQAKSQILLLVINQTKNAQGILTNKLFEYLSVKRPIMAIAPPISDLARLIDYTRAGTVFDYNDTARIKAFIKGKYLEFKEKGYIKGNQNNIHEFSRKGLTKALSDILTKTIST